MTEAQPFLEDFRRIVRASGTVPAPVTLWLDKVDEEIVLVTWLLALEHGEERKYASEENLASVCPPLGYGRSSLELLEELDRCGVIKRAAPGAFDDYTRENASWKFGRMFYWICRYMRDAGLLDKERAHEAGTRINELVVRYGYFGYGDSRKSS